MCSNLFCALRPAVRERSLCFSMNWYHLSSSAAASWHIWEHHGGENLTQQAEQDIQPPPGCGGFTYRANEFWDASHCPGQDLPRAVELSWSLLAAQALRGQHLPKAWWREPVLQNLRDNKSMLISRGVMPHRGTPSACPKVKDAWAGQSQLPHLPRSWWEGTGVSQPGSAREPQRRLLGCRSDICQPLLRAGVRSLFHSCFCVQAGFQRHNTTGKKPPESHPQPAPQRRARPSAG